MCLREIVRHERVHTYACCIHMCNVQYKCRDLEVTLDSYFLIPDYMYKHVQYMLNIYCPGKRERVIEERIMADIAGNVIP